MAENQGSREELKELQAMSLPAKEMLSRGRIVEWWQHWHGNVCVSFSGGKDSRVLLKLVRDVFPDVKAVFSNTGLEYPEIQKFVRRFDNVDIVTPKMRFDQVISTYGYPIIGKEVAEAIYYARRIHSQNGNVEREQETSSESNCMAREEELTGSRARLETVGNSGRQNENLIKTSTARNRRTVLSGRMPGVAQNGAIGEGGAFNNAEKRQKSQFNKEKWLPVARDLPFAVSHYCCQVMKKAPLKSYQRKNKLYPYLATMAEESRVRTQAWMRKGCNAYEGSNKTSQPMSFWTEQDVLRYIVQNGLDLASVYGEIVSYDSDGNEYTATSRSCGKLKCTGCQRTGCIFCGFGAHLEKPGEGRFELLAKTHPRQYEYCIGGGQWVDNPAYDPTAPKMDGEWQNWNPKKIWVPSKKGLGFGKVFEMFNEIYPNTPIRF